MALACAAWPFTAWFERTAPGLRILMYHRVVESPRFDQLAVSPRRFDEQMQMLARSRKVVSLHEGLQALRSGALREPLVAVTFDDGYLDNLEQAAPILLRHRIPATVFVTTQFCDQTALHPRYAGAPGAPQRVHLDWQELLRLAQLPGLEIGSHTLSHPFLPRLSLEQAREEIRDSRLRIEQHLQRPVRLFCYPSGDFGIRERELVRDAGYEAAVSVAPGCNRRGADELQLLRTEVTDRDAPRAFALKLDGAFDPVHRMLHLRRRRHFARQATNARTPSRP